MLNLSPGLTLSDEHDYALGGVPVVGVNQVLKGMGLIDTRFFDDEGRKRGSRVHKAIELDDEGDLDESSVTAAEWPYLTAWRRFRAETGYAPLVDARGIFTEVRMVSPTRKVAGTVDGVGTMPGIRGLVMPDAKTGALVPATALQLGGYGTVFHEVTGWPIALRIGVRLRADGTYRVNRYTDPNDAINFDAALRLYRWRSKNLSADFLKEEIPNVRCA